MMTKTTLLKTAIFSISMLFLTKSFGGGGTWYPDEGRFSYNGNKTMIIDMHWTSGETFEFWIQEGSGWPIQGAGFEIDVAIKKEYFNSCKSDSTFQDKYDDCPTAGADEGDGRWSFGCGTYSGIQFGTSVEGIPIDLQHRCTINFDQDRYTPAPNAWVGINAQTVNNILCPTKVKNPWCYNSKSNQSLNLPPIGTGELFIQRGQASSKTWGGYQGASPFGNKSTFLADGNIEPSLNATSSTSAPTVALAINAINRGAFGKDYGTNQHPSRVKAEFTINRNSSDFTSKFYYLNLNGYDIDTTNEVTVKINGNSYGNLKSSPNNSLNVGDVIAINKSHIRTGINTIEFIHNSSDKWGVTNLYISTSKTPRPPVINIPIDQLLTGRYGNNYGTNQHKTNLVTTFDNVGRNLVLSFDRYNSTTISVFLNDQLLSPVENENSVFKIKNNGLLEGQNTIEFVRSGGST